MLATPTPAAAQAPPTPLRPAGRAAWRALRVLALAWIGWCATLWFAQGGLLYLPAQAGPGLPEASIAARPGLERLSIAHPDGVETEAWLLRAAPATRRGLAVFFHGNAELIDDNLAEAARWNARGFDALLPEYRGYGRTPGAPSQRRLVADALAAIRQVRPDAADPLVLHGRSLGTGIAAQVAAALGEPDEMSALALLVLESPFTSIASFASGFGVPQFLVRDSYRTDEALAQMRCPVVVLGARGDAVVPIEHGRALAARHGCVRLTELDGDHNSGLSALPAYWEAIDAALPAPRG